MCRVQSIMITTQVLSAIEHDSRLFSEARADDVTFQNFEFLTHKGRGLSICDRSLFCMPQGVAHIKENKLLDHHIRAAAPATAVPTALALSPAPAAEAEAGEAAPATEL
eukprot:353775-Chlamydomonas_euryale.AAC.5